MLVLFFGAGISFVLLVGRPIPLTWIKEFVRVFMCNVEQDKKNYFYE